MRDCTQKYYLVKSGEVKRRAEEHRATFLRLKKKLWEIINSFGSDRAVINDKMMLIDGIAFKGDPPQGWTKKKHGVSRPKPGTLKPEIRKYFTPSGGYFIKTHTELRPFGDWLACPFHYTYKTKEGGSGSTTIGRMFSNSFVFWYAEKGPILLELPDVAGVKKQAMERGEIPDDNALDWVPPKGLKEILYEEWKLMEAKYELKAKS